MRARVIIARDISRPMPTAMQIGTSESPMIIATLPRLALENRRTPFHTPRKTMLTRIPSSKKDGQSIIVQGSEDSLAFRALGYGAVTMASPTCLKINHDE
jgi:hypothetical protein